MDFPKNAENSIIMTIKCHFSMLRHHRHMYNLCSIPNFTVLLQSYDSSCNSFEVTTLVATGIVFPLLKVVAKHSG